MLNEAVTVIKQDRVDDIPMEEFFMEILISLMYDDYDIEKDPASQIQERLPRIAELPDMLSLLFQKSGSERT